MIYVITHKKCNLTIRGGYSLLQVGADLNPDCSAGVKDNMGEDNISFKNPCYCEMTGLYWIWKNVTDEYIGLCHYRRFFSKNFVNSVLKKQASFDYMKDKLTCSGADIIVRKKIFSKYPKGSAIDSKEHCHSKAISNCFSAYFPDYMAAYEQYRNGHYMYGNNMFFSKKDTMDQYCEWIFDFLLHLEDMPDGIEPTASSRDAGYIAEHLFNVWIIRNNIKTKEMDVTNLETNSIMKIGARIKDTIYKIRYS